ncbi:hypothetical protein D4R51_00255 [bacterium]|nr:MAG: hypothetical protein D4R51_00255 [bacterium]
MPDTTQQQPKTLNEQFVAEPVSVGLPWRLLIFSVVIFALSLLIYFGFSVGYESYLSSRSDDLDKQLNQLSDSISQQDQQRFIGFYSQMANLKTVLSQHIFSSNIFSFLEKNTLPQTFYTEAKFQATALNLELQGRTVSLQTLAQQLAQFERAVEIQTAILKSTNFNESGSVDFVMNLTFQADFLSKPI